MSASWAVPADAVSGIYFAKLVRDGPRPEAATSSSSSATTTAHSDLLFQTSDTTWQAYNGYGGNSLYIGGPGDRPRPRLQGQLQPPVQHPRHDARRLAVQRRVPDDPVAGAQRLRRQLLHRASTPTAAAPRCSKHKVFLSVGHDEYWSGAQRANVEAARDAGVNLAFFSGNEIFWKTRWENSIDGSDTDHRTLVCYKETHANAKIDPDRRAWTGTWRDPRFSPPADGGRPENALTGTIFTVNAGDRPRSRCRPPTASCASGATPASPTCRRADRHPRRPARSATSGTRTSTTASARRA